MIRVNFTNRVSIVPFATSRGVTRHSIVYDQLFIVLDYFSFYDVYGAALDVLPFELTSGMRKRVLIDILSRYVALVTDVPT